MIWCEAVFLSFRIMGHRFWDLDADVDLKCTFHMFSNINTYDLGILFKCLIQNSCSFHFLVRLQISDPGKSWNAGVTFSHFTNFQSFYVFCGFLEILISIIGFL